MSPGTGLDVLYYMKEKHPLTDVIIMTGFGTIDSAVLAMKMGAFDYIPKPFKHEEILHRVKKAMSDIETKRELTSFEEDRESGRKQPSILGESRAVREITSLVEKISKVDLPVLITGETGTGKNLVAAVIHNQSARAGKPLISINCAGVPEYLIESELFGHTKGAFTGAFLDRKGLFEEADGGTLLLDEIGTMSHAMQAKLLDVLQNRVLRPVGSNRSREVDVRTIAATNTDLEQAVREGKFREDLYYRIKVTHIHLPPLREHPEDIPVLARHLLEQCRREFRKPELQFSLEVMDFLYEYDYSGNVRELYNMICNAAAVSSGPIITMQDMSLSLTNRFFEVSSVSREDAKTGTLEEWEKDLIIKSIRKHSHNLGKVCGELGIGRTTLWRKMKKYSIE
jgi:DNA-binding NtrC family response regulator